MIALFLSLNNFHTTSIFFYLCPNRSLILSQKFSLITGHKTEKVLLSLMKFEILGPSCPTSLISALNGTDSCIFEKAFNQYPARKSMVHTQGIWNATTDRPCHQGLQQHLKCRVGNSESSFGVKALMLDDDVLC